MILRKHVSFPTTKIAYTCMIYFPVKFRKGINTNMTLTWWGGGGRYTQSYIGRESIEQTPSKSYQYKTMKSTTPWQEHFQRRYFRTPTSLWYWPSDAVSPVRVHQLRITQVENVIILKPFSWYFHENSISSTLLFQNQYLHKLCTWLKIFQT